MYNGCGLALGTNPEAVSFLAPQDNQEITSVKAGVIFPLAAEMPQREGDKTGLKNF